MVIAARLKLIVLMTVSMANAMVPQTLKLLLLQRLPQKRLQRLPQKRLQRQPQQVPLLAVLLDTKERERVMDQQVHAVLPVMTVSKLVEKASVVSKLNQSL